MSRLQAVAEHLIIKSVILLLLWSKEMETLTQFKTPLIPDIFFLNLPSLLTNL